MHTAIGVVIGLVVGAVLSYAFRGKEHAAIQSVASEAKGVVTNVKEKL